MKKNQMYSVMEIAQRMNEIGKTKTLKEIGISDRTWRNRLNATDIKYNRQTKKYDIPEIDVMEELEERGVINKEFNQETLEEETNGPIGSMTLEDIEKAIEEEFTRPEPNFEEEITENINQETLEEDTEEDTEEEPNKAIDILSFIKKNKANNENVDSEVEEIKTDEVINKQDEEDEIERNEVFDDEVIESKPKSKKNTSEKERINKKIELEEGYTLHRLSINKELLKRLKFLAVSENMDMDKVIEDLLSEALKNKYYEEINSRAN